jgi:hypothetical protein
LLSWAAASFLLLQRSIRLRSGTARRNDRHTGGTGGTANAGTAGAAGVPGKGLGNDTYNVPDHNDENHDHDHDDD